MGNLIKMLALATILVVTSDASATDGKNYPGSSCVTWFGASSFGAGSGIVNQSTSDWLGVDCPAVKDQGTNIHSGWIGVLDRHNNAAVQCQLLAAGANGATLFAWGSGEKFSVPSSNWQALNMAFVSCPPSGSYFFTCSIPPAAPAASGIHSYHVEEQ